ncbi:MAG: sigma-54-dependent Fis family transcriptional regulator [Bdellovibrionales bacterium]|nr:sigma-54-dependent Fis family transcriptional regulator [Bdellovibrionales bacterium]
MMSKILAVDDNQEALFALESLLSEEGYPVVTASDGVEALQKIKEERPDLVLLDVVMPKMDGLSVARQVKADPNLRYTTLILLTSLDDTENLEQGLSAGADGYITKPYQKQELLARIKAAMRTRQLYCELERTNSTNLLLRTQLAERSASVEMIGNSAPMDRVFKLVEKVKDSDLPVLIVGESGTGKELIAASIHQRGNRSAQPLLIQNCATFNENLLESELFGHVRGAFSGALRDKPGLFEVADGGTFFLDEIGEMSLALQARLLRVLENGTFVPVGATREKKVNVRILAATNRKLSQMVESGKFREDLFYRLNVVMIDLPALRERKSDIPDLLSLFLNRIAAREGRMPQRFSEAALAALSEYRWPGNVRELRNEVERACLLAREQQVLDLDVLSPQICGGSGGGAALGSSAKLSEAVEQIERQMISAALKRLNGNKSEAARELGISRSSLISKAQAYGL